MLQRQSPDAEAGAVAATTATPTWLRDFAARQARDERRDRTFVWFVRVAIVVVVLGAWQALEAAAVFNPLIMSSPKAIIVYLAGLLHSGAFYGTVKITFEEMIFGLVLGVVVGAAVGIWFALLPRFSEAMQPIVGGLNAVPKIALAPLAVVWLGLGISSKVLMASLGVFFVIFFNIVSGAQDLDPAIRWNARLLGLSRAKVLRIVVLPSLFVWITTGLKVAISLALVGAVVGEYVGANAGLGYEINAAINSLAVTRMFALLIALAALGGGMYGLVAVAEKRLLRWLA